MVETQKTEIDGFQFELQQLMAWEHAAATMQLIQLLGSGIVKFADLFRDQKRDQGILEAETLGVMIKILQTASVPEVIGLMKKLLKDCIVSYQVNGETRLGQLMPIFDTVLHGKPMTTYKLFGWALKVNFAGFFEGWKNALPAPKSASVGQGSAQSPQPLSKAVGPVVG